MALLFSACLSPWRPGYDSRPGQVNPGISSSGWRWPWSSLFIIDEGFSQWRMRSLSCVNSFLFNRKNSLLWMRDPDWPEPGQFVRGLSQDPGGHHWRNSKAGKAEQNGTGTTLLPVAVLRIRIRIRTFLGLPVPNPLVRDTDTDSDPSIIQPK